MSFVPGRLELRVDAPPRGAPVEELCELPGEDAPELVAPEHVDDEVEGRVDGEHQVRDGHDLLDVHVLLLARRVTHALDMDKMYY